MECCQLSDLRTTKARLHLISRSARYPHPPAKCHLRISRGEGFTAQSTTSIKCLRMTRKALKSWALPTCRPISPTCLILKRASKNSAKTSKKCANLKSLTRFQKSGPKWKQWNKRYTQPTTLRNRRLHLMPWRLHLQLPRASQWHSLWASPPNLGWMTPWVVANFSRFIKRIRKAMPWAQSRLDFASNSTPKSRVTIV